MTHDQRKNSPVEVSFTGFLSGLLAEGLICLGVMQNPVTGKTQKDLGHASLVIDTIDMLREKTEGNLSKEESDAMEGVLGQLRMGYLEQMKKRDGDTAPAAESGGG